MGSSDAKASAALESRPSTRRPGRQHEAQAWGDDDYDLSAHAVSDGFRPFQPGPAPALALSQSPPSPPSPPPMSDAFTHRPSSTSKPPRAHDSLTLRNDRSTFARRRQSGAPVLPAMSLGGPLIQPESPYRGPSGPSHPYPMYLQRTSSSATASPAPHVDRQSYDGPRGPAHPYALYTQNTAAADETAQQDIPLGFTGMGASYQRQLGPDGEEAGDLIGPLGHLEELPPYTRYPEEPYAARKSPEPTRVAAQANAPISAVPAIPGAGGLGIATRDPEFSSADDDRTLSPSRPASRSEASQHEINTAARDMSEKPAQPKWQQTARKKMWGVVPCWAIGLLVACIVIMGVVMGAVIGTVFSRRQSSPSDDQSVSGPNAQLAGVQPLPALPPNLPALATGAFTLPLLETSQSSKSCFSDPTQAQAWSCDVPLFCSLKIMRVGDANETSNYQITMAANSASPVKFKWGTQAPVVPDPQPLTLVNDGHEQGRGPAWWSKVTYEKMVIVPEDKFPPPTKNSKRGQDPSWSHFDGPPPPSDHFKFMKKRVGAREGDKPWICTWPDTTLEIFIYPSQNVSVPSRSMPPPPEPPMSTDNASATGGDSAPGPVPPYPMVVKFLERRRGNTSPQATTRCRQVEIVARGQQEVDAKDADGKPIEVSIAEREDDRRPTSVSEMTGCGCLWWST